METEITESFLQTIAGDIEKLLIEDQETIAWAFKRIAAGFKLTMGVALDWSKDGIVVNYSLSFDLQPKQEPIEKHKVVLRRIINPGQTAIAFLQDKISKGEMAIEFPDGKRLDKDTIGAGKA